MLYFAWFVVDYSNKEALNALLDSAKEIAKAESVCN